MYQLITIGFILLNWIQVPAQHFIGLNKSEIGKIMDVKFHSFNLEENSKNTTYKYIKYVDKYNEETWLFFLSNEDVCTYTKLMSDFSNLNLRVKTLNKDYKKAGPNLWTYTDKGSTYTIELKKEEWFFTIITKKK